MKLQVPDRLEQAVGEAEARMFCAGSLAQEVVDAKIWSSEKTSCSLAFSATALFQIGAERLFHDDGSARRGPPPPTGARPTRRHWAAR
jgi:hypothetical protein